MAANVNIPSINLREIASLVKGLVFRHDENWDGVPYSDPLATASDNVARLYPDGSIVGSGSNGSYTRYPNGGVICYKSVDFSSVAFSAVGTLYWSTSALSSQLMPVEMTTLSYSDTVINSTNSSPLWVSKQAAGDGDLTTFQNPRPMSTGATSRDLTVQYKSAGRYK